MPVFEGLLPEPHNAIVLDLLFLLCTWHALAKLRLHTFSTLQVFKSTLKDLGHKLRYWVKKTCTAFDTQELPKEASARHRRKAASAGKGKKVPIQGKGGRGRGKVGRGKARMPGQSTRKPANQSSDVHDSKIRKVFNMCTYKLHALGHYVSAIAQFGTTDSYSTQVVNHILYSGSYRELWLIILFRVNLNIDESNAFMHEQINKKLLAFRLQSNNGVNVF
jgi:hypothetical protein